MIVSALSLCCRIFNHPNILPVLGACNQPPNLIVISQFMPFGSLYDVLHGETGTVLKTDNMPAP